MDSTFELSNVDMNFSWPIICEHTVGRHVHIFDPERSVAVHNLLADDSKAVYVTFLRAIGRRVDQPQQLGRRP